MVLGSTRSDATAMRVARKALPVDLNDTKMADLELKQVAFNLNVATGSAAPSSRATGSVSSKRLRRRYPGRTRSSTYCTANLALKCGDRRKHSRSQHRRNATLAMLRYAMLCYATLCYVTLCCATLCYAMICYATLCYPTLRYTVLCYDMLRYALLPYASLCYVVARATGAEVKPKYLAPKHYLSDSHVSKAKTPQQLEVHLFRLQHLVASLRILFIRQTLNVRI